MYILLRTSDAISTVFFNVLLQIYTIFSSSTNGWKILQDHT